MLIGALSHLCLLPSAEFIEWAKFGDTKFGESSAPHLVLTAKLQDEKCMHWPTLCQTNCVLWSPVWFSHSISSHTIANGLHDLKLLLLSCRPCCVGMLRFLMLILTTFSRLCAALRWFKVDAYVKKEHFQEIKLNFSWA